MTIRALHDPGPVQAGRTGPTTLAEGRAIGTTGQRFSPLEWNFFDAPADGVASFRQLRTRTPLPWRTPYCTTTFRVRAGQPVRNLRTINTEQQPPSAPGPR